MPDGTANIVGVGNTLMGDDGVGPVAVEAMQRRGVPRGVELYDAGLAASDVLGRLDPDDPLIVIDALRCAGEPGQIHRARLKDMKLECPAHGRCLSLHELSVVPALQIEALSGRAFRDVTVFGVEPRRIAWGEGLSAPVAGAMDRLIEDVLDYAESKLACPSAGDACQ